MIIKSLLDNDFQKFLLQQLVFHRFPHAEVEYRLINRHNMDFRNFEDRLKQEIESLGELYFQADEILFLEKTEAFKKDFLDYLSSFRLKPQHVVLGKDPNGLLTVTVRGPWLQVMLWELPLSALLSEMYWNARNPADEEILKSGRDLLAQSIGRIKDYYLHYNSEFTFYDMGTAHRYTYAWQKEALETLKKDLNDNGMGRAFLGTTNALLTRELGLEVITGTLPEYYRACQVLTPTPLRHFQKFALDIWLHEYRADYATAVYDTIGMQYFLKDFDTLFRKAYDEFRIEAGAGDIHRAVDSLVNHFVENGVELHSKTLEITNLHLQHAIDYCSRFQHKGTALCFGLNAQGLTHNMGYGVYDFAIELVRCNGRPVARVCTDNPGGGKSVTLDPSYSQFLLEIFSQ